MKKYLRLVLGQQLILFFFLVGLLRILYLISVLKFNYFGLFLMHYIGRLLGLSFKLLIELKVDRERVSKGMD